MLGLNVDSAETTTDFKAAEELLINQFQAGNSLSRSTDLVGTVFLENKTVKECKSKFLCSKDTCNKRHHTLIHEDVKVKQVEKFPLTIFVNMKIRKPKRTCKL